MPFYIVTMEHPDGPEWGRHVAAHVTYLRHLVHRGSLRASGPLKGLARRAGFLIFKVDDRAEVEALVNGDPFAKNGVIEQLTIAEWDPLFGAFADEASGSVDRLLAGAAPPAPAADA